MWSKMKVHQPAMDPSTLAINPVRHRLSVKTVVKKGLYRGRCLVHIHFLTFTVPIYLSHL